MSDQLKKKSDELLYVIAIASLMLGLVSILMTYQNTEEIARIDELQKNSTKTIELLQQQYRNQLVINMQQGQFNKDVVNFANNVTATINK